MRRTKAIETELQRKKYGLAGDSSRKIKPLTEQLTAIWEGVSAYLRINQSVG
jgi:hypothetical protein